LIRTHQAVLPLLANLTLRLEYIKYLLMNNKIKFNPLKWSTPYKVVITAVLFLLIGVFVWALSSSKHKSSSTNSAYSGSPTNNPSTGPSQTNGSPPPTPAPTPTPSPTPAHMPPPAPSPSPTPTPPSPSPVSVTVSANDSTATPLSISVTKGATVSLTFKVQATGTYHGGLEFVGGGVDTGAISPGSSKTISFKASNSFSFTPYWPANSVKKDYLISVNIT
jgi:hypothetical protein